MASVRVDICVATFRRPAMLGRLLESLNGLRTEEDISVTVIIVDNDREGSARGVVEAFAARGQWPVTYEIEPQQNIALARNRCVALSTADYLAFIDDDEMAADDWLLQLLGAIVGYEADALFGPVLPLLPAGSPQWIIRGGFFQCRRWRTGSEAPEPATGNALIAARWMKKWPEPFDPAFGLTGGEDTEFFDRLRRAGARMVWCDEAIVYEQVSADRVNARYLMWRAMRGGQTFARVSMRDRGPWDYIAWFGYRSLLLVLALLATVTCWPLGRHVGFKAFLKACSSLGQLSILAGRPYEHYRRAFEK